MYISYYMSMHGYCAHNYSKNAELPRDSVRIGLAIIIHHFLNQNLPRTSWAILFADFIDTGLSLWNLGVQIWSILKYALFCLIISIIFRASVTCLFIEYNNIITFEILSLVIIYIIRYFSFEILNKNVYYSWIVHDKYFSPCIIHYAKLNRDFLSRLNLLPQKPRITWR